MSHSNDRIALVLGATGGVGGGTAMALDRHGWQVRGLARDPVAAARRSAVSLEWRVGDALDPAAVAEAARGAGLIVHAVNPPGYRDWDRLVAPMLENTIAAAAANGARILLPGTIYNYGPDAFPLLSEDSPQHPTTRKGAIRVALEKRLETASREGVRSLILRAGDFFGPRPGNSWFSQGMVKPGQALKAVTNPGRAGVGHAWAYLPDVAETFAQLADREGELAPFARFHFAGFWDADGTQVAQAVVRAAGDPSVGIKPLPWLALAAASPFNETLREMMEMKTFWRHAAELDNTRLRAFLGAEPRTPLDEAIAATLQGLGIAMRVAA